MRTLLLSALLTLAALAGCIGGDVDVDDHDGHNEHHDEDPAGHGNETVEPEVEFTVNTTTGQAPLTVTFSINATGFDTDFLFWELDAEGDGEVDATGQDAPADFEFTYEDAGNFTAILSVTDGNHTVTANLTVEVSAAPAGDNGNGEDGPNPPQSGTNGDCLDYLVLWAAGINSPLADPIAVEPGTGWVATSDDGVTYVDFFTEDGSWIDGTSAGSGDVPDNAAFALICVSVDGWPTPPVPLAEWTYQDGL